MKQTERSPAASAAVDTAATRQSPSNPPTLVWVADDDESIRWVLERSLGREGMSVQSFPGAAELLDALGDGAPDVLISDIRMPGVDGLTLMQRVQSQHPQLPVIITTAHSDLDAALAAYRGGAFEYLPKPFDLETVAELVRRAAIRHGAAPAPADSKRQPAIIGEAPAMQEVFRAIGRLAANPITVLITGESGTGKERIAQALHANSPRATGPFIAVNTAAIPKDLMESEFFGHERGAFTGAQTQRKGRFEQADGGTLFLDEIGDMPIDLQTRLLRVLQDGQFYRVGGVAPLRVEVRVIAATHQDLERLVAAGRFREDLYHRINVFRIRVPPLRERRLDIPALMQHFLTAAAAELGGPPKRLAAPVLQKLIAYHWPGNVRQLENLCRWLIVMAPGPEVLACDLPPEIGAAAAAGPPLPHAAAGDWAEGLRRWAQAQLDAGTGNLLERAVPAFERALIETALAACNGQRQEAARRLGWGRNTLTRKLKRLGIKD
ncbi:MAG: nitrogen regulation protein NR(I) [Gammaproteobacteria bacterium]|nr:nitrogen regulation protein NR(I) [Gammaproteobacteria bacterium]